MSYTYYGYGDTPERDYFGYLIEPDFSEESSAQSSEGPSWTPSPAPLSNVGPSVTDGQRGLSDDLMTPDIDRSAPSPAPQSAGSGDSGLATLPLPDIFASETRDASLLRNRPGIWQAPIDREYGGAGQGPRLGAVRTRYFDEQEQAQSEISVQDGLLRQQGGDLMDTTQASGTGTLKMAGQGKHLFSLTPEGQVRATDPWASKQINTVAPNEAHSNAPAGATSLDFVNHSSLVAGGSVAGAGELRTERGQLQQISDGSGHYQPQGQHMGQVVDHFEGQGVDMHDVGLRFTGKQHGQRPLIASAREFQAQDNPAMAENAMRTRRANLSDELQRAVTSREQRLGIQNEERTNR